MCLLRRSNGLQKNFLVRAGGVRANPVRKKTSCFFLYKKKYCTMKRNMKKRARKVRPHVDDLDVGTGIVRSRGSQGATIS